MIGLGNTLSWYFNLEIKRFIKAIFLTPYELFRFRKRIRATLKFYNAWNFNDLLILGGGKSLSVDFDVARKNSSNNAKVISLNRYALSPLANELIPDAYILVDPFFFDLSNPDVKIILNYIKSNKIILILPLNVSESFINSACLDRNAIIFVNTRFSRFLNFSSPLLPRSTSGMTLLMAIGIGLKLTQENIFLCGFPSDMFRNINVDSNNNFSINYSSFSASKNDFLNTSVPRYFLAQHFFFSDLHRIAIDHPDRIFVAGNSCIDCFKKI